MLGGARREGTKWGEQSLRWRAGQMRFLCSFREGASLMAPGTSPTLPAPPPPHWCSPIAPPDLGSPVLQALPGTIQTEPAYVHTQISVAAPSSWAKEIKPQWPWSLPVIPTLPSRAHQGQRTPHQPIPVLQRRGGPRGSDLPISTSLQPCLSQGCPVPTDHRNPDFHLGTRRPGPQPSGVAPKTSKPETHQLLGRKRK